MGKGARLACIFLPGICTVGAIICLVLVGLGGTNKNDNTLQDIYFLKVNTSNFTTASVGLLSNTDVDADIEAGLEDLKSNLTLPDYYTIYLWNYCSTSNSTGSNQKNVTCSKHTTDFWFNPVEVWDLNSTTDGVSLPSDLQDALNVDKTASHWMYIGYIVAFVASAVTFVLGFFAICSRWGSVFTTIASGVASLFTIAASGTATGLYVSLSSAFNEAAKDFGVKSQLGTSMFVITWLASALSLIATFFWMFSACCVSGRSSRHVTVEKTPYTYEPVASPYVGAGRGQDVPMTTMAAEQSSGAYEPFRHGAV